MSNCSLQSYFKNQTSSKLDHYWLLHSVPIAHSHSHLRDEVKVTKLYQSIHALDSTATATATCKLLIHVMQLLGCVSIFLIYDSPFSCILTQCQLPLTGFFGTLLSEIGIWLVPHRLVI